MTKSRPALSAWENDRTIVRFPDLAVEVVDERFRPLVVWQEVVERLWAGGPWLGGPWGGVGRGALGWRVQCGSATAGTCYSPTSRTTGCSVGVRSHAMSRYFVSRRTTATATLETDKGDS